MKRKLLAFCVGLLLTGIAEAQTAVINASTTSGCTPLTVTFTDGSTGASSWSWNFGNGFTSALQNPGPQIYFNSGTYNVTLSVNGGPPATKVITVNASPVANFRASDTSGTSCFPLLESFTDLSTTTSGSITSWNWDFGDGNTSTSPSPTHIYTATGNFPVSLQVTSSNGCSGVWERNPYIVITSGVTAGFTATASAGCSLPIAISFNNTSTGPGTLSYSWNFGDGSPVSNAASPQHNYTTAGTYSASLTITSSSGCTDVISQSIVIGSSGVQTSFIIPDSVCVGVSKLIQNTSIPNPVTSSWDFGDGTTSTLVVPTKAYTTPGIYSIKLTNNYGGCTDSTTKTVTVLAVPVANFKASDSVTCNSTLSVNFTDLSTNATNWSWNFGDGTISTLQNPSHIYTSYGTYSVTLTVSNSTGCSGSVTKTNYIQIVQPLVQIKNLPLYGCAPYTFTPADKDSMAGGVTSYLWDFDDGTTSNAQNPPAHTYPAGIYVVKLTITGANGCTVSTSDTVKSGANKPTAAFTATPTTQCVDASITFTDQSTGGGNQWFWDFGDMNSSSLQNPMHSYTSAGTYTVTETVYNNGCNDVLVKTNYIVINLPKADFLATSNCTPAGLQYTFTDNSIGADTWLWDFGDGTTSTQENPPAHVFPTGASSYTVSLTVKNNATGCSDTKSNSVFPNLVPTFSLSTAVTCKNNPVYLVATNDPAQLTPGGYYFNFGDGYFVGPVASASWGHTYTKAGVYSVTVTVTSLGGCKDSATKTNAIMVNGPTAQFDINTTGGCTGLAAVFTDQSTSDGTNPIVQWIWDFGDGTPPQTFTAPPFTHNYSKQGISSVKLTVVDASGCMDSVLKNNLIVVSFPQANFSVPDSMTCPSAPVVFSNNSSGYGLTYVWDFGDGTNSTALSPAPHTYVVGNYLASLTVTDQYGCSNVFSQNITADTPHASFTLTGTLANCPPLIDTFTFTGSYYKTIKWNFGDGGTSTLLKPIHFYTIPGTYYDTLVITSHGGCTDTAISPPIKVLGPYGALTYSPLQACHELTVNFTVTTSNVVKYVWDFDGVNTQSTPGSTTTFTYDSAGKFLPVVILTDASNCAVPLIGTDTIVIGGSHPQFGYNATVFCNSGAVTFNDLSTSPFPITTYLWDFGDGVTSNDQNPTHFYATPGLYTVKLYTTTQTNCLDSMVKNNLVKIVANPTIDIGNVNYTLCQPATQTFQGVEIVPDTSNLIWTWNFYNGNTGTGQKPPAQVYPNASANDSVMLSVVNSSGCTDTIKKYFPVYPLPLTNAGIDTAVCVGGNVVLQGSGADSYFWMSPDNTLSCYNCQNPVATPDTTTTYILTGYTTFGCSKSDSVVVHVVQPEKITVNAASDSICIGKTVQLSVTGENSYTWSPATGLSNPSISNPVASPDTTTTYQVVGTDYKSCFADTQFVKVNVFNYPTIDAGPDATIAPGTSYQINATGSPDISLITWQPITALSCTNCLTPVANPTATTTYLVSVTNNGGCTSSDSVTIIVLCGSGSLFVPNTFSPNDDGVNDVFYIRGKGLARVQSMLIFNRWGQVVFEKKDFAPNDPSAGWDGTINGKKAPVDVYVYTIEVICDNSQIVPFHGNVALIR